VLIRCDFLQPLSASSLKNVNRIGIAADPVSLSPPTAPHSHSMIMSSVFRHIGGLRAFRGLSPRTGDDNPLKRETIQVVFPVAMPSKYRPIHVTEMNHDGRRQSQSRCRELVDYEIAVYDSLWISTNGVSS